MSLPTPDSTGNVLKRDFELVVKILQRARSVSVTEKANLAAAPTAIRHIIDAIYRPFARSTADGGFWHSIVDLAAGNHFRAYYVEQLYQRIAYTSAEVKGGVERITLDGNKFSVNDKVRFVGSGDPPGNIVLKTNYWIKEKVGDDCSFAATSGGSAINLVQSSAKGNVFVERRVGGDFTTLENALEAVIDEIITLVPVTAVTLELRSVKFDKALSNSSDGLEEVTLTEAQTATLRTKLQDVVDAIDAPL